MTSRKTVHRLLEGLLLGIVLVLLIGHVLGQPVLVSYVETGSMEPTLSPGDGFLVVPPSIAGGAEAGDVVIFRAERLRGGGLTTHRIVDETEQGYITKGDANAATDQAGLEPPVQPPQIVAEAVVIRDQVVVLPHVGTLVGTVRGTLAASRRYVAALTGIPLRAPGFDLASLLAVIGLVLYVIGRWQDGTDRHPGRPSSPPGRDDHVGRRPVLIAAAVLVTLVTLSMMVQGGVHEVGVVSAENDAPGPRVIERGQTETTVYPVANRGLLPMHAMLESRSEGIDVQPQEVIVQPGQHTNATVAITAPPEIGYYRMFLHDHRYLGVLPTPVLRGLYQVHPWAPILAIDIVLGLGTVVFGSWLLGRGSLRARLGPRGPPTPGGGDRR